MHNRDPNGRRKWLTLLFWLLFGGGLVIHLLAPNLERKEKAFIIPLALSQGQNTLRPDRIVAKERRMQAISAVLTASGALGLGFLYWKALFRRTSPAATNRAGDEREAAWVAGGIRKQ